MFRLWNIHVPHPARVRHAYQGSSRCVSAARFGLFLFLLLFLQCLPAFLTELCIENVLVLAHGA